MKIYEAYGFECEKALKNTPEDLFNQSEVVYDHEGEKRTLTVVYVRYFDEYLREQNIYDHEQTNIPFYHIAALLILKKHQGYVEGHRLYYNDTKHFLNAFNEEDIQKAITKYESLSSQQVN